MSWFSKLFSSDEAKGSAPQPFMEHPTGDFDSAALAMEDAIRRLRGLPSWDDWIGFSAQGRAEGGGEEAYHVAEIRMRRDVIDVGERPLDVPAIAQAAGTPASSLVSAGQHYSISAASPRQAAHILDAIFRQHLGIRPFPDENNDYAVGAEW